MDMINKAKGFFVRQLNNVNIYYFDPKPSIQPINDLFNNFQVTQALDNLDELIKATDSSNKTHMYLLYLQKTEFFLKIQRLDEFKKLINFIEKNYQKQSKSDNKKFKSLKLIYLSLEKEEKKYFDLSEELSINQNRDLEYYHLIYYVNTNNIEKIIDTLKEQNYNSEIVESYMSLIIGHSYNLLIHNQKEFIINNQLMNQFYNKYESDKDNINKFDLVSVYMSKCISATITFSQNLELSNEEKKTVNITINHIEKILPEINNFGNTYKNSILNNLATFYKIIEDNDKFKTLFENNIEYMEEKQFISYYIDFNNEIDENEIYKIYQERRFLDLLAIYLEYLYRNKSGKKNLIEFIENNNLLDIQDDRIRCFYSLSKVDLRIEVEEIFTIYETKKEDDLLNVIIYLKASRILKKPVEQDFIDFLEKHLVESKYLVNYFLKMLIKLLFELNHNFTYKLAHKLNEQYPYIISYLLELSSKTSTLKLTDIESFIKDIDLTKTQNIYNFYILIGNIYNSYLNTYKTYIYYLKAWEENNDIELAKRILDLIIRMKTLNISIDDNEAFLKVYSYLKVENVFNEIEIALLGAYYHFQNNEFKEGINYFNRRILPENIDNIDDNTLNIIGSLYFKSIIDTDDSSVFDTLIENLLIIENLLFRITFINDSSKKVSYIKTNNQVFLINNYKNSIHYINNIYKDIPQESSFSKYQFKYKSKMEMKVFSKYYKRQSLFHFISNHLIHKASNVQMVETNLGEKNELENIFEMIKNASVHDQSMIDNYNNGKFIPLFCLAKSRYENLAPLMIRELIDKKDIRFNAGINNPIKDAKKLVSISSILLLKYLGHLESVLSLDNVYIQSTVLNWVELTKESIKKDKTSMSMGYENGQFYKHEMSIEERTGLVKVYQDIFDILLDKCVSKNKVVNDFEFSIPFKLPSRILNNIGPLDCYAMAFCINNEYQLITEDISLTKMYKTMKFNPYISNMMALIQEAIDIEVFIDLAYELNKFLYNDTLNHNHVSYIEKLTLDKNTKKISTEKTKKIVGKTVSILNSRGELENIKLQYKQQYMIQDIDGKSLLLTNIEFLLNLASEINANENKEDNLKQLK